MTRPVVPGWALRLYRALLYTYPPGFRRRFGREMEQVFADRCRAVAQRPGLRAWLIFGARVVADWLTTTVREGAASLRVPAPVTAAMGPALDGAPAFYLCRSSTPGRGALLNGAVLSLAAFVAVAAAIGQGASHRRWVIGSRHPSRSHLLRAGTAAVPSSDLPAEIRVSPYPDEPPISTYFQLVLVLGALDADRDNVISAAEIAAAPAALRKLDRNHDGKLSADECGVRFGHAPGVDPALLNGLRLAFMRVHPALAVLDADHDGEISSNEIQRATTALKSLDKNRDGALTEEELLPGMAGLGAGVPK